MAKIAIPRTAAERRKRRHLRVRKAVTGTAERPRLVVFRSLKHIYAQVVDDATQRTLLTVGDQGMDGTKSERALAVGHSFIVQAPAGAISNPLHVSELYYLGRVATRIDGVFIAPAVTADEVGTPSEPAAPAAAAAPAPLPAVLPNTAGELQLPAALGSAVAAILLAAFALSARRRVS
jgi:large subunit ribosomal protein L18